jgi:hypothetical protein
MQPCLFFGFLKQAKRHVLRRSRQIFTCIIAAVMLIFSTNREESFHEWEKHRGFFVRQVLQGRFANQELLTEWDFISRSFIII